MVIGVMGDSGSGKTTSLRNLDPKGYIVYPEPTVNKLLIKDQIKHGINVPGAQIVEHESIIIK